MIIFWSFYMTTYGPYGTSCGLKSGKKSRLNQPTPQSANMILYKIAKAIMRPPHD